MNNINMLYYDRIDISEKIDVNKTSASKGYDICLLVFLHKGFVFQKKKMAAMNAVIIKDV